MQERHPILKTNLIFLAGVLGSSILVFQAGAQTSSHPANPKRTAAPMHYRPDRFAGRAGKYYALIWGVDSLSLKYAESGEVIRFSYRLLDSIVEQRPIGETRRPRRCGDRAVPRSRTCRRLAWLSSPEKSKREIPNDLSLRLIMRRGAYFLRRTICLRHAEIFAQVAVSHGQSITWKPWDVAIVEEK